MSAAEGTAPREDGAAVSGDDAHLSQPSDAVLMDELARVSDASAAQDVPRQQPATHLAPPTLSPNPPASSSFQSADEGADADARPPQSSSDPRRTTEDPSEPFRRDFSAAHSSSSSAKGKEREGAPAAAAAAAASSSPPSKEDESEFSMAIGPAQDEIKATPSGPGSAPVCNLTLLLTTGGRHPYRIDAKYLGRRNVAIPEFDQDGNPDPFSISIYTLKELILREWRSDWEAKPASPSSIRLIYFGKLLDDKEQLKTYSFSAENPNIVHMSIRPQDFDDEEPKSGSKSLPTGQGNGPRARDGRCCVIL